MTGERLYVVVVGTDTLGWIQDQLSDSEDCCVLAEHLSDGAVAHLPFAQSGMLRNGVNIELLGLNRDSTFSEMLDAVLAREVESMRKTYLPRELFGKFPAISQELLQHFANFAVSLSWKSPRPLSRCSAAGTPGHAHCALLRAGINSTPGDFLRIAGDFFTDRSPGQGLAQQLLKKTKKTNYL